MIARRIRKSLVGVKLCGAWVLGLMLLPALAGAQNVVPHYGMPAPKYEIRLEPSVMVPMRDGVRLSTDLYFPEGATGPFPVVLIRTPYDKNRFRPERSSGYYRWKDGDVRVQLFAGQGYVVAVQDMRGKFESEGKFLIGTNERRDGSDTVDWLVVQEWSTGKVGTYGCSYLGECQLQLAAERNPNHAAAIPQGAGGAYTGTHRTFALMDGGAFALASSIDWFPRAGYTLTYRPPPGTPDDVFRKAAPFFSPAPVIPPINYREAFRWLPIIATMERIVPYPTHYEEMVTSGPADPYWDSFNYVGDEDRFDIPALHINSWYDLGINETFALFNLLRTNAESERGRDNQFVIISPTTHCESEGASEHTVVGKRPVGDVRYDYYGTYLSWFDYWLRGIDNGVTEMPKVQYYLMGKNEWRTAESWPVPGTEWRKFFLRSDGRANTRFGDGTLSPVEPLEENPDRFVYDPKTPVPSVGGVTLCTSDADSPCGSFDQSDVEMRGDILVYTTAPLEEGIEVSGPIELVLYVGSSARDTDFTGKLIDVDEDGTAYNLQDGILRARYREGYEREVWMEEGEVYELRLDLHAISNYFAPGHRIRLEVSSSNFPGLDRNLNTGGNNYDETKWVVARNIVYHSARWPSHLVLPVVAGEDR
ncbi:MAG: CocE/NonD family hydrolase [Acidobacteriota bacterium]